MGDVAATLASRRNDDGGFGPRTGLPSEPEPTALAAIALRDPRARAWLQDRQAPDGSFDRSGGPVVNDSATALAALALEPGGPRERALDHVQEGWTRLFRSFPHVPHDPRLHGWAWTEGTFAWVEPTSRALLALRLLRPSADAAIADAVATLRDREVEGGGWNYGNREAFGVELWPYGQTTATALLALHGVDPELEARALRVLRSLWRRERAGGLTVATSTAALRLHGDGDEADAASALADALQGDALGGDVVALAWAAIALGPGLDAFRRAS